MMPPWITEGQKWLGLKEVPGPEAAQAIVAMARDIGLTTYVDDKETWCGVFVGACLRRALPDEPLPKYPAWSRGYAKWGQPISWPAPGAIAVFWRGAHIELDLGHVGFIVGQTSMRYQVLGGNQSDSVSVAPQWKDKLVALRWPSTFPLPEEPV